MQYFVSPWFKIWNWLSTILFSAPVCLSIISGAWSLARENFPLRVIIMYFYTICIIFTNINTKIFSVLIAEIWNYTDEKVLAGKEFYNNDKSDFSIIAMLSFLTCHLKLEPQYQDYLGLSGSIVLQLTQPKHFLGNMFSSACEWSDFRYRPLTEIQSSTDLMIYLCLWFFRWHLTVMKF